MNNESLFTFHFSLLQHNLSQRNSIKKQKGVWKLYLPFHVILSPRKLFIHTQRRTNHSGAHDTVETHLNIISQRAAFCEANYGKCECFCDVRDSFSLPSCALSRERKKFIQILECSIYCVQFCFELLLCVSMSAALSRTFQTKMSNRRESYVLSIAPEAKDCGSTRRKQHLTINVTSAKSCSKSIVLPIMNQWEKNSCQKLSSSMQESR